MLGKDRKNIFLKSASIAPVYGPHTSWSDGEDSAQLFNDDFYPYFFTALVLEAIYLHI